MFWPNNQGNKGNQSQNQQSWHPTGDMSPFSGESGGGTPFRSPHHKPRYQSSPRYYPQYGSPFPDPYRMPAGTVRPQRSPHPSQSPRHDFSNSPGSVRHQRSPHPSRSPRHEFNYSPQGPRYSMDSFHGDNRKMSTPMSGRGRGGRQHYHSGNRDYSMQGDCNPGSSDDISMYYSPCMLQDPWEHLTPVPYEEKT